MRPVDFEESNKTLAPPSDLPAGVECGSLPIWTDGQQCVSVWELEGDAAAAGAARGVSVRREGAR